MKKGRDFREVQKEYEETVAGLCCVCSKPVSGFYGRWGDGGTCSGKCERIKASEEKYPEHKASDFEEKHGL